MSRMNVSSVRDYMKSLDDELLHLLDLKHNGMGSPRIQDYIITAESLSTTSADLLKTEYGFHARENQDVLSLIWGGEYADKFRGTKTNLLFARSFWSAAKQNELRIARVFQEWHVFPKIFAACGPLYIAEYIPSLKSIDTIFAFLSTEFPSWKQRATLAKEILNFVQKTDSMELPLQLCDIKSPHFGFTPANAVRFIDADAVITDDALGHSMSMRQCLKHEDCSIFDCEGWCNENTGRCAAVRTNNNLQTVCAKVFRGSIISTFGGLLSSPPQKVAEKLPMLINQCADDITGSRGDISLRHPTQETLVTLQQYLIESLGS
ncbi:unnamed protein product [Lymnaea stagnalis]|uniref:FAM69 protein-kinase domain-containing protein n=1 Tax=Lymnaea stagnalis TaxID=6523 RepID=A0AAV2H2M2_LYMST